MSQSETFQTAFDKMVNTEHTQMIKAALPYLPANTRRILSVYSKCIELTNTLRMFSFDTSMQACSVSAPDFTPTDMINDMQKYCYGQSREQLNQINNLLVLSEMISLMNQS